VLGSTTAPTCGQSQKSCSELRVKRTVPNDERVKVLSNSDVRDQRITAERPMLGSWYITDQTVADITTTKPFMAFGQTSPGGAYPAAAFPKAKKPSLQRLKAIP
jgi:glutaredoxin-related protein